MKDEIIGGKNNPPIPLSSLSESEWNFNAVPDEEILPALLWEMVRESNIEEEIKMAQAWLAGELSGKRAPMPKAKRTGKRLRYNSNLSDADLARMRINSVFQNFIPWGDYFFSSEMTPKEKRAHYEQWNADYIRPLLLNYEKPWSSLPQLERSRLCEIIRKLKDANVVKIGTWCDAVCTFKKQRHDLYHPLKFDYGDHSAILVVINWKQSSKRILVAIKNILRKTRPGNIEPMCWRGKKDRDNRVQLERLAIMRLLHHYTLSEIPRLLPEAWRLYGNRKWYDDRRQALHDFRSHCMSGDAEVLFPRRWQTKAQLVKLRPLLPAKQPSILAVPVKSQSIL